MSEFLLFILYQDPSELFVGENATVSGWGGNDESLMTQKFLKATSLTVISQKECQPVFAKSQVKITKDHLCMLRNNETVDFGDSGGKLFLFEYVSWYCTYVLYFFDNHSCLNALYKTHKFLNERHHLNR